MDIIKAKDINITSYQNTDKELWRKVKDDYFSPSIHLTEQGNIGISVGGFVVVMPIEKWHKIGRTMQFDEIVNEKSYWKRKIIFWLLGRKVNQ